MKIKLVRVFEGFSPIEEDRIVCTTDFYPPVPCSVSYIPVTFKFTMPNGSGAEYAKEHFSDARIEVYPGKCPTCYREKENKNA